MKRILVLILMFLIVNIQSIMAQCAMCRATVGSNLGEGGNASVGASLNDGILYLLVIPYAIVILGVYFYRKSAKENLKKQGLL